MVKTAEKKFKEIININRCQKLFSEKFAKFPANGYRARFLPKIRDASVIRSFERRIPQNP